MKIIYTDKNTDSYEKTVCCIGYFDALHKGHQELIKRTVELSHSKNLKAGLICFEPDPTDVITGKKQKHIFSFNQRTELMESFGIDIVYIIHFDEEFMKSEPKVFINDYLNVMNIDTLVCGFDYSFGYKGKGNSRLLKKYGTFNTEVIEEYTYYGKKISSTRIRDAIYKGNIRLAEKLLGFEYYAEVITDKCVQMEDKWLIEAHTAEEDILLPHKYILNDICIDNDNIFISSDSGIKKGKRLKIKL